MNLTKVILASECQVLRAEQRVVREVEGPFGSRTRGAILKDGGNASSEEGVILRWAGCPL